MSNTDQFFLVVGLAAIVYGVLWLWQGAPL